MWALCRCSQLRGYLLPHQSSDAREQEICSPQSNYRWAPPQGHLYAEHSICAICAFHMCICMWACLGALPLNKSAFLLAWGPLSSVTWKKLVNTLSTIILLALHNHLRLPIKLFLSTWICSSTVPHTAALPALSSSPFLGPEPAPILCVYTAQGSSEWDKHILFSKTPSCFGPKNVLKHFH